MLGALALSICVVIVRGRAPKAKYRFAIGGGGGGGQDISAEQELRNSYRLSNVKGHLEFKRELKPEDGLVCLLRNICHLTHV